MKSSSPLYAAKRRERGVVLLLGALCLPVIVAILGITVDLSIMYAIKGRLQMACDGAAVAVAASSDSAIAVSASCSRRRSPRQGRVASSADTFRH